MKLINIDLLSMVLQMRKYNSDGPNSCGSFEFNFNEI